MSFKPISIGLRVSRMVKPCHCRIPLYILPPAIWTLMWSEALLVLTLRGIVRHQMVKYLKINVVSFMLVEVRETRELCLISNRFLLCNLSITINAASVQNKCYAIMSNNSLNHYKWLLICWYDWFTTQRRNYLFWIHNISCFAHTVTYYFHNWILPLCDAEHKSIPILGTWVF